MYNSTPNTQVAKFNSKDYENSFFCQTYKGCFLIVEPLGGVSVGVLCRGLSGSKRVAVLFYSSLPLQQDTSLHTVIEQANCTGFRRKHTE